MHYGQNLRKVAKDELDDLNVKDKEKLAGWDRVAECAIRLREHGHIYFIEIYIISSQNASDLVAKLHEADEKIRSMSWRLFDLTFMPVQQLPDNVVDI